MAKESTSSVIKTVVVVLTVGIMVTTLLVQGGRSIGQVEAKMISIEQQQDEEKKAIEKRMEVFAMAQRTQAKVIEEMRRNYARLEGIVESELGHLKDGQVEIKQCMIKINEKIDGWDSK